MKKAVTIIGVILFFLLLIALLLFKLLAPAHQQPTPTATTFPSSPDIAQNVTADMSPNSVVEECISWYLRYFSSSKTWTFEQLAANPTIQRCFTASFISSWKDKMAVSETDSVLLSPDYYVTWLSTPRVRTLSQLSQSADVEVRLGSGEQESVLIAHLQHGSSGWQVDSVTEGK